MYVRGVDARDGGREPMVVFWRMEDLGAAFAAADDMGPYGHVPVIGRGRARAAALLPYLAEGDDEGYP